MVINTENPRGKTKETIDIWGKEGFENTKCDKQGKQNPELGKLKNSEWWPKFLNNCKAKEEEDKELLCIMSDKTYS